MNGFDSPWVAWDSYQTSESVSATGLLVKSILGGGGGRFAPSSVSSTYADSAQNSLVISRLRKVKKYLDSFEVFPYILTMEDPTEQIRRNMVQANSAAVESGNPERERTRLEQQYGQGNVWDTAQLQQAFTVHSFLAPFCLVTRKSDGVKGAVEFQHSPRLYFDFQPD